MKSYSSEIGSKVKNLFIVVSVLSLASCSWVSSRRSLFGGDSEEESSKPDEPMATVPKSQFDSLQKKYQTLLRERQLEQVEGGDANKMMNQMESEKDPSMVISDLGKVKNAELAETVDVFSQSKSSSNNKTMQAPMTSTPISLKAGRQEQSPAQVEDHIAKIRKVEALVAQNKFDMALNMIKELEKSPIRQIVVRAKYLLGEVLFKQGEYDLSMQIFEEVLTQHAFSGLVIKTLGRLIVCSDKLKISEKQEKYYSILHDFFEQGS